MLDSPHSPILETDRFKLSPILERDVEAVFDTMNSRNVADMISFLKWLMTLEQAAAWCKKSEKGLKEKNEFLFLARYKEDSAPIGCISLHLAKDLESGEVGYWVSEGWQGCGCASEMLKAIIVFAFDELDLDKLIATAAFVNPISVRVLQKHGFQIIGKKDLPTAKGTILTCHLLEKKSSLLCS